MKEITIKVPEDQVEFFYQLIEQLGFSKSVKRSVNASGGKKKVLKEIKQGLKEVKLAKAGKLKSKNARQLLNEL